MQSFEERYQSYLDLLRDNTPTVTEVDAIERQVRRLNHDLEYAGLDPDRRLALIKLRNETMTAVAGARHRARIDDARAVARAIDAHQPTPAERRQHRARTQAEQSQPVASPTWQPPRRRPDRGISR